MSKDELLNFRRHQIEDYHNSGLSAVAWCEVNPMKLPTLRYWLKRLKVMDQPEPAQTWATVTLLDKAASVSSLVVVKVNTYDINLYPGFDPAVLTTVIKTLQGI